MPVSCLEALAYSFTGEQVLRTHLAHAIVGVQGSLQVACLPEHPACHQVGLRQMQEGTWTSRQRRCACSCCSSAAPHIPQGVQQCGAGGCSPSACTLRSGRLRFDPQIMLRHSRAASSTCIRANPDSFKYCRTPSNCSPRNIRRSLQPFMNVSIDAQRSTDALTKPPVDSACIRTVEAVQSSFTPRRFMSCRWHCSS